MWFKHVCTESECRRFVFVHDMKGFAAEVRDGEADGLVPGGLQPEQLLARLEGEVVALLPECLDEETVLPLVHILALLDHSEHGLEHLGDRSTFTIASNSL